MNARQRVIEAINHREPDRPPLDLASSTVTGMAVSTMAALRASLGLEKRTLTVMDEMQMLGEPDEDLTDLIRSDVIGLWGTMGRFGFPMSDFKEWTMPDGLTIRVPGKFTVTYDHDGSVLLYARGDTSYPPCAKMPAGGYFFDLLSRQGEICEEDLDARRDFGEQFGVLDETELRHLEQRSIRLYNDTELAVMGNLPGMSIGSSSHIPGASLPVTPGIRRIDDWYMAHYLYPEYVHDLYAMQTEIALKNLELLREAVGERIQTIWISGTDFGSQSSELMSADMWREFYKPYYKQVNDWIHAHTGWKTFYHTCGSIPRLIPDMIDAGIDILNPVQCSAAGMDAQVLKDTYGDKLVFWGGGVDTQKTLPFGTPEEVFREVQERLRIFAPGGGYIFSSIHNIVAKVPPENVTAFYNAYKSMYGLPLLGESGDVSTASSVKVSQ